MPLKKTQKVKVFGSKDIYPIMQKILMRENKISRSKEHFWTVGLDNKGVILYIELLGLGTKDFVTADHLIINEKSYFSFVDNKLLK